MMFAFPQNLIRAREKFQIWNEIERNVKELSARR